jgi:hypothetical protein
MALSPINLVTELKPVGDRRAIRCTIDAAQDRQGSLSVYSISFAPFLGDVKFSDARAPGLDPSPRED